MSLIDKIKKARETGVEVDGFRFNVRLPSPKEMHIVREAIAKNPQVAMCEVAERFVVGWDGVKEIDLIPGGTGVAVEFDHALWAEWCQYKPQFWFPIADAALKAYNTYMETQGETKKKP
jgi:hypothetical protein